MDTAASTAADDLRDMYAMHTLLRRELGLAPGLVRNATKNDVDQAQTICEHISLMLQVLAIHHERHEDCSRFYHSGDGDDGRDHADSGCSLVTGLHARLHAVYNQISARMRAWRATASDVDAKSLALALECFALLLSDFLAEREEQVLWPRTAAASGQFGPSIVGQADMDLVEHRVGAR
jgi:hypothetical protein